MFNYEESLKKWQESKKEVKTEVKEKTESKTKKEKLNKYGVKVGDIFYSSWGYEQTNINFFQVVEIVGECSVRVREIYPDINEEKAMSSMSRDISFNITNEILPACRTSVFIKDQEKGDLKRIKPGYYKDEQEAKENCYFDLSSFANAYKYHGEELYESWYA